MADMRTLTVDGTTYNIKDATARADIVTMRTDVNQLKTDVTQLKTDVTQLKTDVTQLQNNTADLPQIRENVENNADDIRELKTAIAKYQIYDTASGSVASFPDGADDEPIKELIVNVDPVQAGSGDPSPDNVRPITGWTQAKVTRTGKNLCPTATYTIPVNSALNVIWEGNVTGTFTINMDLSETSASNPTTRFICADVDDSYVYGNYNGGPLIVTGTLKRVRVYGSTAYARATGTIKNIQIEAGSTATAYEPYNGNTYDIEFPTEAGTVYGGTLTVNADGTGKLLVKYNKYSPTSFGGTFSATENAFIAYVVIISSNHTIPLADRKYIVSNKFKYSSAGTSSFMQYDFGGTTGANTVWAFGLPPTITTLAEANTWLADNPIEFTYLLAEPIEYTLTAQQVINTLLGQNNIWADTGDVSATYPADLKLYIDKVVAG